jgi:hypothetical protein
MKKFLLAIVSASPFLLGTGPIMAESSNSPNATQKPQTTSAVKGAEAAKKETGTQKKRKPFTPEDIKQAEANKKKVEWWQMPKPAVPESRRSSGGSHAGH